MTQDEMIGQVAILYYSVGSYSQNFIIAELQCFMKFSFKLFILAFCIFLCWIWDNSKHGYIYTVFPREKSSIYSKNTERSWWNRTKWHELSDIGIYSMDLCNFEWSPSITFASWYKCQENDVWNNPRNFIRANFISNKELQNFPIKRSLNLVESNSIMDSTLKYRMTSFILTPERLSEFCNFLSSRFSQRKNLKSLKEFWGENSEDFYPERWLQNKSLSKAWFYQPFGGGPRNCIGLRLARMEIKLGILKIIQKFDPM